TSSLKITVVGAGLRCSLFFIYKHPLRHHFPTNACWVLGSKRRLPLKSILLMNRVTIENTAAN
ncbi:MAG: hypothetical protein V7L04_00025, partial [Nostoc sp.]|uniref:hypothetical protein n=1 Tax=Nostoc sp. TaxID=1180 RepID=UPI002FF856B6